MLSPLLAAAAPFALLAQGPPVHDLCALSRAGERLRTTYTIGGSAELVGGRMQIEVGGEVQDMDLPKADLTVETRTTMAFLDEVVEAVDGRRRRFVRTFESLDREESTRTPEGLVEDGAGSVLEERAVAFEHTGDEWQARWSGDGPHPDDELLEHLDPDLSFAALLPPGAVEIGATWEPQAAALEPLEAPSGYVHLMPESADAEDELARYEQRREGAELESLVCRLVSVEDGRARVAFEARGRKERWDDSPFELEQEEVVFDVRREHRVSRSLDGELLWDLRAGRLVSLRVEAESSGELIERRVAGGVDLTVILTMTFQGNDVYEVRVDDA
jgi:hypothetical protein